MPTARGTPTAGEVAVPVTSVDGRITRVDDRPASCRRQPRGCTPTSPRTPTGSATEPGTLAVVTRFGEELAQLAVVRLAWLSVLTILVTITVAIDVPTALAVGAVAIVAIVAIATCSVLPALCPPPISSSRPPGEERRLRGAFRRQSAPNTPGRPRRPRAPGRVLLSA